MRCKKKNNRRTSIRKLKESLLKNNQDKKDNKKLVKERKKEDKKLCRKVNKENKFKKTMLNKNGNISRKKRLKFALIFGMILCLALIGRTFWIQFIDGEKLQELSYLQQTSDRKVSAKRGIIYDATGKVILANNEGVETVTISPSNIKVEDKEKIAKELSELFDLDYESVIKKVSKKTAIEKIASRKEKELTNKLRKWMEENNITTGINIDEDTKRIYPYNSLASQIIGFCGSDNQGLNGIEAMYESSLKGTDGKILKLTDAKGATLIDTSETYEEPINGNSLILTIDSTIQGIAEKYLKEACIDNVCTDGGNIIIMNPNNGDILAFASYPNYNLNEPYTINDETLKANWSTMSSNDKSNALQSMWRNKGISDTYEPGSTFKLVTASTALDTGVVTSPDNEGEFCCVGYIDVAGVKMKCWRYYKPHGPESLRQALMNSCNPIFIGLGGKIGVDTYYNYLDKFGFFGKTGIDLPGEATGIFLKKEKVGPVELRYNCIWPKI